jgi:hypothetical protein
MINQFVKLEVMSEIIQDLEALVQPEDTGHIRTAISVLKEQQDLLRSRLQEITSAHM